MKCKTRLEGDTIYLDCINSDGDVKIVTLEISDCESNFKLVEYKFSVFNCENVWNVLPFHLSNFDFINAFKVKLINDSTKEIEYEDIILTKSYSRTKFADNTMPHDITMALYSNWLESFNIFKGDSLGIKNDKVLVDLGSTIGVFTAYALQQNPNIKSVCVEMNPNFHKVCSDTFKDNPNIIPINAAIYKTSGETVELKSIRGDFYDLGNTVIPNLYHNQDHKLNVNTISLEDVIKQCDIERINLLKVDIEGYEYELFENLSDEILDKIDKILLEFHRAHNPMRRLNLINRLMIKGFKFETYDKKVNFYSTNMFTLFFTK
jgi:FkbM family methyltransferase